MKNTKFEDRMLIGLASIGMSQTTMASLFNCHQTAVSARMKKLGLRNYKSSEIMEDIFFNLSPEEKEWFVQKVESNSIKAYLLNLVKKDYLNEQSAN